MTWETRRRIRDMYVYEFISIPRIAKMLGCAKETVRRALLLMNVETRKKTSLRICRIPGCGKECFKRLCKNGRNNGRVLSGGLCLEHSRERWREKNLARRRKAMYSKTQEHQRAEPKPKNGYAGVSSSSTATV
jgi:hypothetical protein